MTKNTATPHDTNYDQTDNRTSRRVIRFFHVGSGFGQQWQLTRYVIDYDVSNMFDTSVGCRFCFVYRYFSVNRVFRAE